ncbi:MAG: acyl-CoA dehydrogenase family protein, partial [Proteobacteria bacterium]|nr:acyl-CoA dehydrogenase family protein [Pseudomonadota bacterium]
MSAPYTEQQEAIRKLTRDFCEKEVISGAQERDRTGEFDYGLYR